MRSNPARGIMAQIMDSGTPAMATEALRGAQAEPLADEREVVTSGAIAEAYASIADEKRDGPIAEQSVPFSHIVPQSRCDRTMDWNEPRLVQLRPPNSQDATREVDIAGVQRQGFADPETRDRDESEER